MQEFLVIMCSGVNCYQGGFIMLDCKEAYELICKAIDREVKFNELETIFSQNKTDKKNNNEKLKR